MTVAIRRRPRRPAASARFWRKVDFGAPGDCWRWTGAISDTGYGDFFLSISVGTVRAHRWAYEERRGPIPRGMDLDHLCRVRHCVNPDHLEPVTRAENLRRGRVARGVEEG